MHSPDEPMREKQLSLKRDGKVSSSTTDSRRQLPAAGFKVAFEAPMGVNTKVFPEDLYRRYGVSLHCQLDIGSTMSPVNQVPVQAVEIACTISRLPRSAM